mgnify:CR=1 FL=1
MKFMAIADSDIGIVKDTNQDSLLIKHADTQRGEVLLAIVCDGMGGLTKGEVASATVIKAFSDWFDTELEYELENPDMRVIGGKWSLMLKDCWNMENSVIRTLVQRLPGCFLLRITM